MEGSVLMEHVSVVIPTPDTAATSKFVSKYIPLLRIPLLCIHIIW